MTEAEQGRPWPDGARFLELPGKLAEGLSAAGFLFSVTDEAKPKGNRYEFTVSIRPENIDSQRLATLERAAEELPAMLIREITGRVPGKQLTFSSRLFPFFGCADSVVFGGEKTIPVCVMSYYDVRTDLSSYMATVSIHA